MMNVGRRAGLSASVRAVQAQTERARGVISKILPAIQDDQLDTEFEWLEIDSFDLVTLRVSLEEELTEIPDATWVSFRRLRDILDHFAQA
jgi:acyl carrier protein